MKKKPDRVRLSLDVERPVRATIELLGKSLQTDSITEVIRRSVLVLSRLRQHRDDGGTLILRQANGLERELEIIP